METAYSSPTEDILTPEYTPTHAETSKRFINYLVDFLLFYAIIFGVSLILAVLSPDTLESIDTESVGANLLDRLLTFVLYALYMGTVESIFKGKSLGKLITKTRAVNYDGTPISVKTAFLRGFSRAVPFCAFSAFGSPSNPWQDKWTDTLVADDESLDKQRF
ncbi:MAG: RDD family protein [Chitinophagaceae bacterium]|nr:MAG: RDD family protein [Chitinophagaceae bacterium]